MNMANMDFEVCYRALELPFGAGLKEINERWRKLSRIHHPDRHATHPRNYQIALEKQKQLNNARDVLKKWFETNPHATPPRSSSQQTNTQNNSASANTSNKSNAYKSQSNNTNAQTKQQSQNKQQQSNANQSQRQTNPQPKASTSTKEASPKAPNTGWFAASELKLTPMQDLVQKINIHCSGSEPSFLAMIFGFAAVFGPLFVISGTLGSIFPELPGHYPDWLMMTMLSVSGLCTCYIFRWFFAESELIKLQQKEMYFRSRRTAADTVTLAKSIIRKHNAPNETWKFTVSGAVHEATLHFEEEVFPEVKRSRNVKIRFEVKPGFYSVLLAVEVRTASPINGFSCKRIVDAVLHDLNSDFQQIAS
jgi:DNA mismatch repair ATPase MutL